MHFLKKNTSKKSITVLYRPLFLLLFLLYTNLSYGQRSAESIAKGETLPSAGHTLFSPSALGKENIELTFHHENLYCTKKLNNVYLDCLFPFHPLPLSLQFNYWGYHHYRRYTLSSATAKQLTNCLIMGCSLNYSIYNYTGSTSPIFSIGTHIDCLWNLNEQHRIYGKIFHLFLTHQLINQEKDWISIGYILSLNNIEWTTELNLWDYNRLKYHIGFEYEFTSFMIRLGAKGLPLIPSCGLGYTKEQWKGCFSVSWLPALGQSFSIDICYHLTIRKS